MSGGYLHILKAKTILLNPPDPFGNQVTSHKGTPASASLNGKDSTVDGFALSI